MTKYQNPINTRRESRTVAGRTRGGKLNPVMAVPFRPSESGILSQTITYELDPIAGRMITPITAEMVAVYVPIAAIESYRFPEEAYAGNEEVIRDKLTSGVPLYSLEQESQLSKRMGVVPRSIGGIKQVTAISRLAHNCAVDYLRKRKYVKATPLPSTNYSVTPALIGSTVLERLNGVLDPEDRVNGAVKLSFGNINLPIDGIAREGLQTVTPDTGVTVNEGLPDEEDYDYSVSLDGANDVRMRTYELGVPRLSVNLEGVDTGQVSLEDFYNAEIQDNLTRQMREIVDQNPEYGEEMVARWAHGLSVDSGRQPFILARQEKTFGQQYRQATDGANLDVSQTDMAVQITATVPVPATEFGGIVVTFCVIKPDETLASQPHPILSEPWGATNYVAEELLRDPVPVTIRDLNADCLQADEETRAMYVGHNGLKKGYVNYGFNRHLDKTTVAAKTALWQLEVPMSVTPSSVLYPENLNHYPFADQLAEVCTYTINSVATVSTPMIFGPTPVEELAIIETEELFGEDV